MLCSVNSDCLRKLNAQLLLVSGSLDLLHEHMERVVKETGETWKDRKFEMFLEEVEPCQQQLINLSLKYKELSSQIQPLVELIEEMERKTIV